MKRFFILTLVCTTALNACYSKEQIEQAGFYENWDKTNKEYSITDGTRRIVIACSHVPTNEVLPYDTEVYFPVPVINFLENKYDTEFKTNGAFDYGLYLGPEEDSSRIGWSIIADFKGRKHTVPTARLRIRLTKESLEKHGYKENWEDRCDVAIRSYNGSFINKNHMPAQDSLPSGTEVYIPISDCDYSINKNDFIFTPNGRYKHGTYCKAEKENPRRMLWSITEDNNGNCDIVPTARLMVLASPK
jgi:hypothetical protein